MHQIVKIDQLNDRLYDPSYGTMPQKVGADPRTVELIWEDMSVAEIFFGMTGWAADIKGDKELSYD
jgi:hypothetical protein